MQNIWTAYLGWIRKNGLSCKNNLGWKDSGERGLCIKDSGESGLCIKDSGKRGHCIKDSGKRDYSITDCESWNIKDSRSIEDCGSIEDSGSRKDSRERNHKIGLRLKDTLNSCLMSIRSSYLWPTSYRIAKWLTKIDTS